LVEVARTLQRLLRANALSVERTIRLLWVPEFFGTLFWAEEHRDRLGKTLFSLNLDMVGQSPERIGEPLQVSAVPGGIPDPLNAWFEPVLRRIAADRAAVAPRGSRRPLHWTVTPPSGGSDHVVFTVPPFRLPAVMIGHEDPYWHTDLDTIEMVDATELQRVAVLTASLSLLPGLLDQERDRLAGWLLRYSAMRLCAAAEIGRSGPDAPREPLLDLALTIEQQRGERFAALVGEAGAAWEGGDHRDALEAIHGAVRRGLAPASFDGDQGTTMPRCRREGPLPRSFRDGLAAEDRRFLDETFDGHHGMMLTEMLGLCDGRRTMPEIIARLALEFGIWMEPAEVERAAGLLIDAGYLGR
jgi:hypothetical protein